LAALAVDVCRGDTVAVGASSPACGGGGAAWDKPFGPDASSSRGADRPWISAMGIA
jgi:hypothetical protein